MTPSIRRRDPFRPFVCTPEGVAMPAPLSLTDIQALAAARGGECLSDVYAGSKAPHEWRCGRGHIWTAPPVRLRQGCWCPRCARRGSPRLTLTDLRSLAATHGGACLAAACGGADAKVPWRCGEGHVWETTPSAVRQGRWCPFCAYPHHTIAEMVAIASARGGACLSDIYLNVRSPLSWRCGQGHVWSTTPNSVLQGTWCPRCASLRRADDRRALTLARRLEREGGCLSVVSPTQRPRSPILSAAIGAGAPHFGF